MDTRPARPTIGSAKTDGAEELPDNPDWFARALGGASLITAGIALWLNWQKNERDLAALRPQVGISAERQGAREWKICLTVTNPLLVPIVWRTVHVEGPEGLGIADAARIDSVRAHGAKIPIADTDYTPFRHLPEPITIEPKGTHAWNAYARIHDHYGAPPSASPVLRAGIDGFDQSHSRLRRMAKWIWPSAIRT
ncbi:hypothetical protein [Methylobacterium sp. D48H]